MAAATLALGLIIGVGGCSDKKSTTVGAAGSQLASRMADLRDSLTAHESPPPPWAVSDDGRADHRCGADKARRQFAATLDLTAQPASQKVGTRELLVLGQLDQLGWTEASSASASSPDQPARISAHRKADPSGTRLEVSVQRVGPQWHYVVAARTGCLPTS